VNPRRLLPRSFYARPPVEVAVELLNKVLIGPNGSGRIVEVEAYDGVRDPASHAYRGLTPRNAVMFGPPAHLYVYFTYGMHWCANAVCRPEGDAAAVLLRAIAPIDGLEVMRIARKNVKRDRDLGSGPAKLCQALAIGPAHNGVDLTRRASPVRIVDDGVAPPTSPVVTPRVGLSVGVEQPWRWYVAADVNVSRK